MKPLRRAKLLMLTALLPLAGLATLVMPAAAAHAAPYTWPGPLPLDPYQVHLGDGYGCSSNNLTAYGWNFQNGEQLSVKFYYDGILIGTKSATANQSGYLVGFFAANISTYLGGNNDYTATVTELSDRLTWPATEQIIC